MFFNKDEKILVLLFRVEEIRYKTLMGFYKDYSIGEEKIKKLHNKIIKLGGNPKAKIEIS